MKLTDDDIKSIQTLGHYFARVPKEQIAALINRIFKSIDENHGIVTEDTHSDILDVGTTANMIIRDHYTAEYGFVYLYEKFIDALAEYLRGKKVLSVMSGTGILEHHLKLRGVISYLRIVGNGTVFRNIAHGPEILYLLKWLML